MTCERLELRERRTVPNRAQQRDDVAQHVPPLIAEKLLRLRDDHRSLRDDEIEKTTPARTILFFGQCDQKTAASRFAEDFGEALDDMRLFGRGRGQAGDERLNRVAVGKTAERIRQRSVKTITRMRPTDLLHPTDERESVIVLARFEI